MLILKPMFCQFLEEVDDWYVQKVIVIEPAKDEDGKFKTETNGNTGRRFLFNSEKYVDF